MDGFTLVAAAAFFITPTIGVAQESSAKIKPAQKAWLPANFRSFDCSIAPGATSAVTGAGTVSFDASGADGVDFTVSSTDGGVPTITAHAINTKGTGGTNGRLATQSCPATGASSSSNAPACTVSGDVESPTVRFTVPLTAMAHVAAGKSYVGTVTIVKRALGEPMIGMYFSKKGYDYYQARGSKVIDPNPANPSRMIVASCDSTRLTAKGGKPSAASYDLAVGKK